VFLVVGVGIHKIKRNPVKLRAMVMMMTNEVRLQDLLFLLQPHTHHPLNHH
jgi:hypothetical protein